MTIDSVVNGLFIALGCLLLWAIVRAAQPRPVFTLRIKDGAAELVQGRVKPSFVATVGEIAAEHEISHGTVRGFANQKLVKLSFSSSFPPSARQQMRNVWSSSFI